jgi:diguanylate cyclase (GGDEF)-like protein/PAS domain S-box-containing protein
VPDIRFTERGEQALLPMAAVSLDGLLVDANAALARLLHEERDALVGRPVADVHAAASRPGVETLLDQLRRGAPGEQARAELACPDGSVPVLSTWTLMRTPEGEPHYCTVIFVDETERVRAERALAAGEARWRALLAHAADVTWTGDADGTMTSVTAAVPQQLGWEAEALVGQSSFDLVHPDDVRSVREAWQRLLSGDEPVVVEFRVLRGDGEWVPVRQTLTDLRDDPAVGAVVGNLIDISLERERDRQLARQAALWRARFDQSSLPQTMTDLDGRLLAVNDAACAMFGRSREELVGQHVSVTSHPEDDGSAPTTLSHLLAGRRDHAVVEWLAAGPDGEGLPLLVHLALLRDPDGRPEGAAAFFQDLRPLRQSERRRAQQDEFHAFLTAHASELSIVADAEGRMVYVSPAAVHVLGHDPSASIGAEGWDFMHPDDVDRVRGEYAKVVEEGGTRTIRMRVRSASDQWHWMDETATNLLGTSVGGIVCNLRDVTDEVESQEALRASEARFRAMAETAEEGIWLVSLEDRTTYANARTAEILGVSLTELQRRPPTSFLAPHQVAQARQRLAERAQDRAERYEIAYAHPDGTERRLWVAASPLHGQDGRVEGSMMALSDVTEARRAEQELRRAALHDALTGLPNRALLDDRLEHAVTRETVGTAVLFLDLDHFKLVNDSRGHRVGDQLLVGVAQRLTQAVRPTDTVARFGGDEFVVVCEDADEDTAVSLASEVLAALAEPVDVDGVPVHVRASIGVALSPATPEDLLRYADSAMYAAKTAGRGRVRLFDRALAGEAEQRFALAADLRTALAEDALTMHYQPVVDLQTGEVRGMEALARWTHPEHGPVAPADFVHVAELTGLAPQLDRWALRRALSDAGRLRASGSVPADAFVAVNLSAHDVADVDLEHVVAAAAEEAGLEASQVVLEITETAVMEDTALAIETLGRLRARGFQVAVDDFGTGYSSLAYLRNLPITSLKIDRSFVCAITEDRDALAIVASIIDLARAVGVHVVAEGVETAQQAALLRRLGCAQAQGWLWSPAVPADEVRLSGAWLREVDVAAQTRSRVPGPRPDLSVRSEHGLERLLALHQEGASLATVAAALNREGFRTPAGMRWHRTSVARAVADAAYPALGSGA